MAKLTPEQKAQNKIRTAARDAAFRARKKVFRAAMEEAEAAVEKTPKYKSMKLAGEALEAAIVMRQKREDELRAQVRAIELEIAGLNESMGIDDLKKQRKETSDAYFHLKTNTLAAVDAQFPDVCGVFSAPQWEALGHYKHE